MSGKEINAGDAVTVTFDKDGYAGYMQWVADTKKRNVANRLSEMGGIKTANRRQTLVMRRMKDRLLDIAPDEDIAAYGEIHKLKNPSADPKQKTFVTDNEIKAYKALDPEFKAVPVLETIVAKVEAMIAAGELTAEGNVAEEVDEGNAGGEAEDRVAA